MTIKHYEHGGAPQRAVGPGQSTRFPPPPPNLNSALIPGVSLYTEILINAILSPELKSNSSCMFDMHFQLWAKLVTTSSSF